MKKALALLVLLSALLTSQLASLLTLPTAQAVEEADPLGVTINRLTPGSLTPSSDTPVVVEGRVRNTSQQTWSSLSVYLLTSQQPITTAAGLSAAMATAPADEVGSRITDSGLFVTIPHLAPGASTAYRLSVPRASLGISEEPGVYWLGVHVLGTDESGERPQSAIGRARTFLPLVAEGNQAQLTVALQVRDHVVRQPDGVLLGSDRWASMVERNGRLHSLLGLLGSSGSFPVSLLLDPSVVDAVASVAAGNPAIDLSSNKADPSPSSSPAAQSDQESRPERAAEEWLNTFAEEAPRHNVLTLPYGDLDVSSVAEHDQPQLLEEATALSADAAESWKLDAGPVVSQRDGYLSPKAYAGLGDTPVLLTRTTTTADTPTAASTMGLHQLEGGGRVVVVADDGVTTGPQPEPARFALAVRQRILAEAALMAQSSDQATTTEPLVVLLPATWNPGRRWEQSRFFAGLSPSWVEPVNFTAVLAGADPDAAAVNPAQAFPYPEEARAAALPPITLTSTSRVLGDAATLEEVLTDSEGLRASLSKQAMVIPSNASRGRPFLAAGRAESTSAQVHTWLDDVAVNGPSFVTMSSENGTFQVTLTNGLEQPVKVALRPTVSGSGLTLSAPEDPLVLGPGQRRAIKIDAKATDIGLHKVVLQAVSTSGAPVGQSLVLSVRSSHVGLILWIVMGVAGTILLLVVILRIFRRIRQRRAQRRLDRQAVAEQPSPQDVG